MGEVFDAAGLIWGPLATIAEFANDPQAAAVGLFPVIDHEAGAFRTIASPVHIDGIDVGPRGPAPEIGEHTDDVLAEVGYTAEAIEQLRSSGIIA